MLFSLFLGFSVFEANGASHGTGDDPTACGGAGGGVPPAGLTSAMDEPAVHDRAPSLDPALGTRAARVEAMLAELSPFTTIPLAAPVPVQATLTARITMEMVETAKAEAMAYVIWAIDNIFLPGMQTPEARRAKRLAESAAYAVQMERSRRNPIYADEISRYEAWLRRLPQEEAEDDARYVTAYEAHNAKRAKVTPLLLASSEILRFSSYECAVREFLGPSFPRNELLESLDNFGWTMLLAKGLPVDIAVEAIKRRLKLNFEPYKKAFEDMVRSKYPAVHLGAYIREVDGIFIPLKRLPSVGAALTLTKAYKELEISMTFPKAPSPLPASTRPA